MLQLLLDPTDLVIQGELMRQVAMGNVFELVYSSMSSALFVDGDKSPRPLIASEKSYTPMHPDFTPYHSRLLNPFDGSMVRVNACICTPMGAHILHRPGQQLMDEFVEASTLWKLQGVTRDNTGAALGNCDVIAFETGRLAVGATPVEGHTISDGSGNYTIPVALNTHYEVIAYLAGSPDRAGITLRTLTPVQQ